MNGVALIPARGGSKRIPRKNVRPFLGEPALTRVIRTVLQSEVAETVLVSTEDDEIARVARSAGAEVPGPRPSDLADDHTPTIDVVRHAIDEWLPARIPEDLLWVVYPTALLLAPDELRRADERLRGSGADFLVPVLRFPHPVERRLRMDAGGLLRGDDPSGLDMRTQDLPPAFHDAGQYYVGSIANWRRATPLTAARTLGLEQASDTVVDLDEPQDWERAERLMRLRTND